MTETLYIDGNAPVGKAKIYRCPHCKDGETIKKLEDTICSLEDMIRGLESDICDLQDELRNDGTGRSDY